MSKIKVRKQGRENLNPLHRRVFLSGIVFTTLLITPTLTVDGFNFGKFIVLFFLGAYILPLIPKNAWKFENSFRKQIYSILIFAFPINLMIVFAFNDANKLQQLYGDFGRRSGLITYLSCFFVFLFVYSYHKNLSVLIIKTLVGIGTFSAIYTLLQPTGIFRIDSLRSKNMTPYGFFGNSNFNSAILGISSIALLYFLISSKKGKTATTGVLFLIQFSIYRTNSQQGFIVFFAGSLIFLSIFLMQKNQYRSFAMLSVSLNLFMFIVFLFGLFGRGFAADLIFQKSVEARNFYWSAGWEMTKNNGWLGVGLDRYGDWYWKYRSSKSIEVLGAENFSASAHNIFLDISSSGGFPLLITYIAFIITVLTVSTRYILSGKVKDMPYLIMFSSFVAFQIYSLFSIGHIGILVWNFVFAGLLFGGAQVNSEVKPLLSIQSHHAIRGLILSMTLFVFLSFPIVKESFMSKQAQTTNTVSSYMKYLQSNTIEPRNISLAIQSLKNTSNSGISFARKSLINFPNYYDLWYLLYINPESTEEEKSKALENLIRLNPYNQVLLNK